MKGVGIKHVASKLFKGPVGGDFTAIAQDLYAKNLELAQTNRMLSLLRTIDGLVLDAENSLEDIAGGITSALINNSSYGVAAIFVAHNEDSSNLDVKGLSIHPGYEVSPARAAAYGKLQLNATAAHFAEGSPTAVLGLGDISKDMLTTTLGASSVGLHDVAHELHLGSLCLVKLMGHQKLVGMVVIGMQTLPSELKVDELSNLGRIGEAVGVALDSKILNDKYQRVLKQLERSNDKLKALDEAKDEFISMASHQLRTPLTSIKGYLSMVLEGDVGEVAPQQKEMLETAFTSAQRMVYLISDLLNVSRLQTGKFVIETAETYLPDVIEQELSQLREAIAAKNIKLTYDKPKSFAKLMLDETKIRQVIMNFTDNALYYTPAGGEVHLELKETPKSVEFTVKDNGIGVPKDEQHKLFAKFYRAGNARKARPDGTGLGLFMAKKVIIASGGALIFKSREGHGSTFGFTFPKTKPTK